MNCPAMVRIRQRFATDSIDDPAPEVMRRIREYGLLDTVKPGMRVAVTAGSRGIHCIDAILGAVVSSLRTADAVPFVIPAMGSHGGGTAEGQAAMLESLGITELTVGCPVVSTSDTVELGVTASGTPVFMDRAAYEADAVVVVNRVKLHTAYHGPIESGLCKMTAVGLGKKPGAETMHRLGLGDVIVDAFRFVRERKTILFGMAILENAFDRTLAVEVVPPDMFEETDARLLERSRGIIPRIPLKAFDILIVDEMGKNISGTGMDTNIIGFWRRFGGEKDPDYTTLIIRTLTEESHGNAMGIGLADLTTERLVKSIDFKATYMNAMTSQWSLGRIPITLENDRACLEAALKKHDPAKVRIVRIKNTLELDELWVSETLLPEVENRADIDIDSDSRPFAFDSGGFLM